jgi:hypothetical protein
MAGEPKPSSPGSQETDSQKGTPANSDLPGACHPSYLGGSDQEDRGLRPAQGNSSGNPVSKMPKAKWTGGCGGQGGRDMAQMPAPRSRCQSGNVSKPVSLLSPKQQG